MESRGVTFRNCVVWFAAIAAFSLIFRAERPVKVADVLWLCMGIFVIFGAEFRKLARDLWPRLRPYSLYFLLIIGSIAFAQALEYSRFGTAAGPGVLSDYWRLTFNFAVFLLAALLVRYDSRILRYASIAIFISPLLVLPAHWSSISESFLSGNRLRGFFSSPIDFSTWMMAAFLIGMALLLDSRALWKRTAIVIWLAGIANFILWSGTRATWLALFIGVAGWAMLDLWREKKILRTLTYFTLIPAFAFTVGYLLLPVSEPQMKTQEFITDRLTSALMHPLQNQENTRNWHVGGPLLLRNPLGFGFTDAQSADPESARRPDTNSYLELAFDGGIIALAAFCMVLYSLLREIKKAAFPPAASSRPSNIATAWLIATPAVLVAIFFTDAFLVRIIWITFGFSFGAALTYAERPYNNKAAMAQTHRLKKFFSEVWVRIVAVIWKFCVDIFRGKGLQRVWPFGAIYDWMVSVFETHEWPEAVEAQGFTIYAYPLHRASLALWGGKGDKPAFDLFEREITRGGTVIDVGANIGHYALHLARAAGENGKVFSFEPGPESLTFLRKNIAANDIRNITVVPKAVGDHSGTIDLFLGHEAGGHQTFDVRKIIGSMPDPNEYHRAMLDDRNKNKDYERSIPVDLVSLDDYFKDYDKPIDFVKIDVEGAEDAVLAGMKHMLKKNPKIKLFFEFTPTFLALRGTDPGKLLVALRESGFALYNMHDPKNFEGLAESASPEQLLAACKGNTAIDIFAKRT